MRADGLRSLGVLLLATTVILAATSGYEQRTFDAYVHLFFADHYARSWFDLWEPRWYGGFSATSYPPLVHQLLALLAKPLGYERAYVVLTALVVCAVAFTTARLAKRLSADSSDRVFAWALCLAALSPTIPRFAYVYGQLPTLTATPLVLTAMLALDTYIRTGRVLALACFTMLVGAVGGAHHISMLFAALGSAIIGLRALVESRDRARILRTLLAATCAGVIIASVIWPFLRHATAAPQAEIPHMSRLAIWKRPVDIEVIELAFLLLFSVFYLVRGKQWVLASGLAFLAVLSAGATTPITELLFRSQFKWLTYDKFHVWASALTIAAIAVLKPQPPKWALYVTVIVLVPLTVWSVSHKDASKLQPPFVKDISQPLAVLNQDNAEKYRHLTLGFGDQSCRFDIYGKSPNIDGDYHTARNHPLLRESGMSTIDTAKYYEAGPRVLKAILAEAPQHSLRWVLVFDDWYYSFLFEAGFELRDVFENGVSVFEKDVPPISTDNRPPSSPAASFVWSVLPLTYLLSGLVLAFLLARRQHQRR